MQARAILEAAADRIEAGGDPRPEIMIPLVGVGPGARDVVKEHILAVAEEVQADRGLEHPVQDRHHDRAARGPR